MSRSRSSSTSSPSNSTSRPDCGRKSTRSPSFATRTSGPTRATSAHMRRFGAGIAVAGIRSPAEDVRSPLSGVRTTSRSPVRRTCPSAAGRMARGFFVFARVFAFRCTGRGEGGGSAARGMLESVRVPGTMPRVKAGKLLDQGVKTLKASPSIDHWQKGRERIEAEDLLMHALGWDEEPAPSQEIPGKVRRRFEAMVDRRATGEPIPFIKGYAEFRGLELIAEPGVFVPRDSSEFLAEQAVRRLRRRKRPVHVDLATGGG